MNRPEPTARQRLEATLTAVLRRPREDQDPKKIERKLQADVAAWLKGRSPARPGQR